MAISNGKTASGISTSKPSAASWRVLDGLPSKVRRVIHEAPVAINPESAAALLAEYGYSPDEAADALVEACQTELRTFAMQYRQAQGYDLPHAAARVSVLGYATRQVSPSASSRSTA